MSEKVALGRDEWGSELPLWEKPISKSKSESMWRGTLLKIAGQEHPDRHRPTAGIKQWMAPAVDTQLNQLFRTQFHQTSVGTSNADLKA